MAQQEQKQEIKDLIDVIERSEVRRRELMAESREWVNDRMTAVRAETLVALRAALVTGLNPQDIAEQVGIARSTIYRWIKELRRNHGDYRVLVNKDNLASEGAEELSEGAAESEYEDIPEWSNARLNKLTGEVFATSPDGDDWVLGPNQDAWNKTANEIVAGRDQWPLGAELTFLEKTGE